MPINYFAIIRQAYHTTIRHPRLWLLGLFLAGGFNANFIYLANLKWSWREHGNLLLIWLQSYKPESHVTIGVGGVLVLAAIILIAANWAKILFVLETSKIFKLQRMKPSGDLTSWQESPRYLVSVIAVSLFTFACTTLVLAILGGAPKLLFDSRGAIWLLASIIFILLVFFFSCLNIFATFFIIFYRRHFASSLNLAFDLILSRWQAIVEMAVLLLVIYGLCFFIGTSLLYILRFATLNALAPFFPGGAYGLVTALSAALLWLWLAVVNTFFNISLMLLFSHLVRPPYHPEFKSLIDLPLMSASAAPAPSASSTAPYNVLGRQSK